MSRLLPSQILPLTFFLAASLLYSYGLASEGDHALQMVNEARATARAGKYPEALTKLQEAISLAEESGQKLAVAIALTNIAEIHRLQGNTLEALDHYNQALTIYQEIDHQNGIAITGRQIGEMMGRRETVGEKTTLEATEPILSEVSAKTRETLIDEAIERVRSQVRARQAKEEPDRPVPSEASRETLTPSQEPPPGAKSEPTQVARQLEYATYLEEVKRSIVRAWEYPEQASRKREEGKVDLEFTILRDGRLGNVRIMRSSGTPSLDQEAVRAVRAASPFNPIPELTGLARLSISFTFNYTLEKSNRGSKNE